MYVILDTDYMSYAVVFACSNFKKLMNGQMAWILSRNRELSPESKKKAMQVFENQNIETKSLIIADQKGCRRDD